MKSEPLVSIIIVNWNGGGVIDNCLKSLQSTKYLNKELIFVDNNSTDNSVNLIQHYQKVFKRLLIVRNKTNVGFALANNQGAKEAKGEYVLLLNNDTKVKPDFLIKLVGRMEEDLQIGVIQPKIFLYDKKDYLDNAGSFLTRIGFLYHWGFLQKDSPEFNKERYIFSGKGACLLIKKDIIEKIGLFDKDFFAYFEESDFCWRVWLAGYKILYYPQAIIYHKVGFTIRRLNVSELNYHYYKNRVCSLIKNLETKNLLFILLPHLIVSIGIFFLFIINLKPGNSLIILKALVWNVRNLPSTLRKRKIIQSRRIISDDQLFTELSEPINWKKYYGDFKRVKQDLSK